MTSENESSPSRRASNPRSRPITLEDVASEARVAKSTVSRALNNPGRLNSNTQNHVREIAQRLGYQPIAVGRRTGEARTDPVALIVPDMTNPYFFALMRGAEHGAAAAGHHLILSDSQDDPEREIGQVERLAGSVGGFVLASSRLPRNRLRQLAADHRIVVVNRQIPGMASVVVDPIAGPDAALRHLASLGHREIAYVAGVGATWTDSKRWNSIRSAATAVGAVVRRLGPFHAAGESGSAAADALVADGATAAIVFNDVLAIGVLDRLRERGRCVPDDISVVGFDDVFGASFCSPPLTTVAAPLDEMGRAAVHLLLEQGTRTSWTPRPVVLPAHLVVRGSTSSRRWAKPAAASGA